MAKFLEYGSVLSQKKLCDGIYDLTIKAEKITAEAKAGQVAA